MTKPCPQLVDRIAAEEAHKAGITLAEIKKPYQARRYSTPRKRAFVRIVEATGCTPYALATVWGCGCNSVRRAVKEAKAAAQADLDQMPTSRPSVRAFATGVAA